VIYVKTHPEISKKYSITSRGAGRKNMKKQGRTKLLTNWSPKCTSWVFVFLSQRWPKTQLNSPFGLGFCSLCLCTEKIPATETTLSSCNHGHLQGNLVMDFPPFSYFLTLQPFYIFFQFLAKWDFFWFFTKRIYILN